MKRLVAVLAIILLLTVFVSTIYVNRGRSSLRAQEIDSTTTSISWSPDGSQFAAGNRDGNIYIYDANGNLQSTLHGHTDEVLAVAWNPDPQQAILATASADTTIKIWDTANWSLTDTLSELPYSISTVAWSPDGVFLGSGTHRSQGGISSLQIWNRVNWNRTPISGGGGIADLAWSPDGTQLADALAGDIFVVFRDWGGSTFQSDIELGGPTDLRELIPVYLSVAWHPIGTKILVGTVTDDADGDVRIIDVSDGTTLRVFDHGDRIYSVTWSPDGSMFASAGLNGDLKIWNPDTGELLDTISHPNSHLYSVAWQPNGNRIAYGGDSGVLHIIDAPLPSQSAHAQDPYPDTIYEIAWSSDGTKIAAASGTGIHIWDAASPDGDPIETFEVVGGANSLAWSPDGNKIAIGHWDGHVSVWDMASQSYIVSTEKYGPLQQVTSIGWSADGTKVFSIGFFDGGFIIWNAADLSLMDSKIAGGYDFDVNFDHTSVVQGTAGTVAIRDVSTGEITQSWPSHDLGTTSIAWSPDETQVAGGGGGDESVVYVWDRNNPQFPIAELQGHTSYIQTVDWSENNLIASADTDLTIRIWDGATFELITSLPNTSKILAWSPDGTKLAYGGSGIAIEIIDAPSPPQSGHVQPTASSQTETSRIRYLATSPDGNKLAVGYLNGTVELRDEQSGEIELSIHPYHTISAISWSPDSSALGITYSKAIGQPRSALFQGGLEIIDTSGNVLHDITVDTFSPNAILAAVWNPNGDTIAAILDVGSGGGGYHRLMIWNTNTGAVVHEFGSPNRGSQIDWSPDGSQIVVTSFEYYPSHIVDASSGEIVATLETEQVSAVAWNESGDQIATGSVGGQVIVWDVDRAEAVFIFESVYISDLAWSPDGRFLASATLGDTIDIWEVHQGILASTYTTSGTTSGIAWSADGSTFLYSDYDRIERVDAPQVN